MTCIGHGAVLNSDGEVELDSIIMDGKTLATGAISSVRNIANPVSLARAVMEKVYFIFYILNTGFVVIVSIEKYDITTVKMEKLYKEKPQSKGSRDPVLNICCIRRGLSGDIFEDLM